MKIQRITRLTVLLVSHFLFHRDEINKGLPSYTYFSIPYVPQHRECLNPSSSVSPIFINSLLKAFHVFLDLALLLLSGSIIFLGFLSSLIHTKYSNHFNCFISNLLLCGIFLSHPQISHSSLYLGLSSLIALLFYRRYLSKFFPPLASFLLQILQILYILMFVFGDISFLSNIVWLNW